MLDENSIIHKAKSGDRDALNELVTAYWHPIYRFASSKTANPDDAQEITQETFLRGLRALSSYQKTTATFKTYLGRIAQNLIIDFWRKKGRQPPTINWEEVPEPPTSDFLPEESLENKELAVRLTQALSHLPPEQRQVVELRIIAGLPVKDAAIAMKKSEAAIKMLQQRALKNLRSLLDDPTCPTITD